MRRIRKSTEPLHFSTWKQQFLINSGREPVYSDIYGTDEYGKLKKELLEEQGYICCYCEKRIGGNSMRDCTIEHFMPRNPDPNCLSGDEYTRCVNAQLQYENLFASCKGMEQVSLDHCNHKKDNWFDFKYCVSPTSEQIEGIFGFRTNGKIFAEGSNLCAEKMKQHLNLDTYVLQEQRKTAYSTICEVEFDDVNILDDEYVYSVLDFYSEKDTDGKHEPFISMITYCIQNYILN